jgi:hypothetical protein
MKLTSLLIFVASISAHADEPNIDIIQASEKGKSVIVLTWDNGKKDSLLVKDVDLSRQEVVDWFNNRLKEH